MKKTILLLLPWFFFAGVADAQPKPPVYDATADKKAETLLRKGNDEYKQGHYREAREAFLAAFDIHPSPDIAANLAYAENHLSLRTQAAAHLAVATRTWPPTGNAKKGELASQAFVQAKTFVGTLRLKVKQDGAAITVDDKPSGFAPLADPIFLDPGKHVLRVTLAGYETESRNIEAVAGKEQDLPVELTKSAVPPPPSATAALSTVLPPPTPSGSASAPPTVAEIQRPTPVLIGGLALAGLGVVGGVVSLAIAGGKDSSAATTVQEITQARGPRGCQGALGANADCQSVANNLKSEDTFHTVAVASFIGAGVAGAAGVALHFALGKPKAQESSLRVVPVVGKTNGVAATWTW